MKKVLPILVLLAFCAFCYQLIVTFFTTEHKINYSLIASDQKNYVVSENFRKYGKRHYYSFLVQSQNKKKTYTFSIEKDFNKQKRVITDFKYYKKNNLECIFPIYKKNYTYDVSCLLDGKQVSAFYLLEKKNEDFSLIAKKFAEDGYDEFYYTINDSPSTKEENLFVSYDYIPKDYIFAIWNYRGIYTLSSEGIENNVYLNEDYYENTLSMGVGKYYVTVNTDKEEEKLNYYQLIIYDLVERRKNVVDVNISQDSYFNGSANGLLYITDLKEKKQYTLDPNRRIFEEMDRVYEISNSKLKKARSDFFSSPKVDSLQVSNKQITKLYGTKDIKKNKEDYYFKTLDGKIYRVIQNDYAHPVLLCQFDNMKEWQVHDDGVSFIVDDTLYLYTDIYGLKPILKNAEFKYNSKNIYYFVREA